MSTLLYAAGALTDLYLAHQAWMSREQLECALWSLAAILMTTAAVQSGRGK